MKLSALHDMYIPEPNTGCWLWLGPVTDNGYGRTYDPRNKGIIGAHRLVYEIHKGPIPKGLQLDHRCRQRSCVNPDHLDPVTPSENIWRGLIARGEHRKGRSFCKNGHPLTQEGIYINPNRGVPQCRECRRISSRKWQQKAKQERDDHKA